jgi:hypothetical protein
MRRGLGERGRAWSGYAVRMTRRGWIFALLLVACGGPKGVPKTADEEPTARSTMINLERAESFDPGGRGQLLEEPVLDDLRAPRPNCGYLLDSWTLRPPP